MEEQCYNSEVRPFNRITEQTSARLDDVMRLRADGTGCLGGEEGEGKGMETGKEGRLYYTAAQASCFRRCSGTPMSAAGVPIQTSKGSSVVVLRVSADSADWNVSAQS